MTLSEELQALHSNPNVQMAKIAQRIDTLQISGGQGVAVANLGTTTNLPASNFTAAIPAEPTKAEVDLGIDALKTATESRLDAIEAKLDALLTSLRNSGQIA